MECRSQIWISLSTRGELVGIWKLTTGIWSSNFPLLYRTDLNHTGDESGMLPFSEFASWETFYAAGGTSIEKLRILWA
jgi:hypothetical protein